MSGPVKVGILPFVLARQSYYELPLTESSATKLTRALRAQWAGNAGVCNSAPSPPLTISA